MNVPNSLSRDSLDFSSGELERILHRAADLVSERYSDLDGNAHPGHPPGEVRSWFDESLPADGMKIDELLELVRTRILDTATLNIGPNMYAYVMGGGNQVSILGDLFASAIDQNVTLWHLAPALTEVEKRVIQWTGELIGTSTGGGVIVSGGSAANLTGLTVARNIILESAGVRSRGLFGQTPLVVYASRETHSSVDKSVELLGLGSEHYRKVPVDDEFRIDVERLNEQIGIDRSDGLRPFCIIGNAGTVNTGAIDPLDDLAEIAERNQMWLHVDGCYGGLAASLPELATLYAGLERASSIAVDFHKWLYQPFEVGCTLVQDWSILRRTFHTSADYLESDPRAEERLHIAEHTFQLSRNAKALKVWMTVKAFGADRLKAMIRKDIAMSVYLEELIESAHDFELVSGGPLAIRCFRYLGSGDYTPEQIADLNERLIPALEDDGRVFITGTRLRGMRVLRACVINHRIGKANIERLLAVIREVGRELEVKPAP